VISLTDLAERLGYSDKAQLKELARRHAANLSKFGTTLTAKVVSGFGRVTEEPLVVAAVTSVVMR
jgi:hypothetical protein